MKQLWVFWLFLAGVVWCNSSFKPYYGLIPDHESIYHFESQVLTGVPDIKDTQLAGLKFSSEVRVQSQKDFGLKIQFEEIRLIVVNSEHVQLDQNGRLYNKDNPGLVESQIPIGIKDYLEKPFLVHLNNGMVQRFYVDKSEPNFVTNIRRSFLSQIQLDVSKIQGSQDFSIFESQESSILGNCKSSYSVNPMTKSESIELENEWKEERNQLLGQNLQRSFGEDVCRGKSYIRVTKDQDLEDCQTRPVFQQWVGLESKCDENISGCPELFTQTSTSTCFVCVEEGQFVIRKCVGKGRLLGSPLERKTKEKLDSVSLVNIELLTRTKNISFPLIRLPSNSDLKEKKSLIFEFENGGSETVYSEENKLPLPDLKSAPNKNPFGLDLVHRDVVEQTDMLLRKIVLQPSEHSDQAKYLSSVSKYLRVLSFDDLLQIESNILSQSQESAVRMKDLFYNVLSVVGTNPSVMFIKQNIENGILFAESATKPLRDMFRSVKTPTKPLLAELVKFVQNLKTKSNDLHNIALGEMSRLLFRACIHPTRRLTEFPVWIYGEFCSADDHLILRNWIPYLESELEAALNGRDPRREKDIAALLYSLGQLGHDGTVKALAKTIGKEFPKASPLLRSFAVFNLKELGIVNPSLTKQILFSIIDNSAEDIQVRVAAISTLPWRKLTKSELVKMASRTWTEPSAEVTCFIHKMFKSQSKSQNSEIGNTLMMVKPCQEKSSNNIFDNFKLSNNGRDGVSLKFNEDEKLPEQLTLSNLIIHPSFIAEGFSSLILAQGLDDLLFNLINQIQTDIPSSQTVQNVLERLNRQLNITKLNNSPGPEILLQTNFFDFDQVISLDKDVIEKWTLNIVNKFAKSGKNKHSFEVSNFNQIAEVEIFGPSISGFLMYAERFAPLYYSFNGSVETENLKNVHKLSLTLEGSLNANLQTSLGVISPLTQEFLGSGIDSGIQTTLPALECQLEMLNSDHFSLKLKRPEVKKGNTDDVIRLFHTYLTPFTAKKNLKSLLPPNESPDFKQITSGESFEKFPNNWSFGSTLGMDLRITTESDSPHRGPSDNLWQNILTKKEKLNSILDLLPSSIRKASLTVQSRPIESHLKEVQLSLDIFGTKKPLSDDVGPVSDESTIVQLCKENYPLSLLEFDHCLHFMSNLEEIANDARSICHRQSFPNESSRLSCHKTADICEGALETCKRPHGPRTRRCHLKYHACKSRFAHFENAKKKKLNLQTSSVTKSSFALTLNINDTIKGLKADLVHSSSLDSSRNRKSVNFTMDSSLFGFNLHNNGLYVKARTSVPIVLTPVSDVIDTDVTMEVEVRDKQDCIFFTGILEKTDQLRLALRNTSEYAKCVENELENVSECDWVASKATSMDKINGTVYDPRNHPQKEVYQMLTSFLSYKLINDLTALNNGKSVFEKHLRVEAKCDLYGKVGSYKLLFENLKVDERDVPIPKFLDGYVPFSVKYLSGDSIDDRESNSDSSDSCLVNTNSVDPFSNDKYGYSINDCLHLLFKDCSDQLPFAVMANKNVNGLEESLTLQVLAGPISVVLEPKWINGSRKMSIVLNVDDQEKELILTPEQISEGQVHVERNPMSGADLLKIFTRNNTMFSLWFYREKIEVVTDGQAIHILVPPTLTKNACGLCGNPQTGLKTPQMCSAKNRDYLGFSYMLNQGTLDSNDQSNCSGIPSQFKADFYNEKQSCIKSQKKTLQQSKEIYNKNILINEKSNSSVKHLVLKENNQICISKTPVSTCLYNQGPLRALVVDYKCAPGSSIKANQLEKLAELGEQFLGNELSTLPTHLRQTHYISDICKSEVKNILREVSSPNAELSDRLNFPKSAPSCSKITEMREALLEVLADGDLVPDVVRLGFHSCVGGCNGCLNWKEPANRGLETIFNLLEREYVQLNLNNSGISRADFWALASIVAVDLATSANRGSATEPCFEYHWGREDCSTSPVTNRVPAFPHGDMNSTQMFHYFYEKFGLTRNETVTLMGVHSLGEAKHENGGYNGVFTPRHKEILNNTYYVSMINNNFKWVNKNAGRISGKDFWQWISVDPSSEDELLRLNTDFEIFFELDLYQDGKSKCILETGCDLDDSCGKNNICPKARTFELAKSYALNRDLFFADFRRVFTKVLSTGSSDLLISGGTCSECSDREEIENKIRRNGYPIEAYSVTTEDCYILELHRIPFGKKSPKIKGVKRPVAYLQHGLFCSSIDWVFSSPDKSLAYILADAGYDVWMGNYRGNAYSRKHCTLNPNSTAFWNFSWDEMGDYDLPALINKTLQVSGQEKLFYIGHSMGTTGFLVMANKHPGMQRKIILANLMAPVAYVQHMRSPARYLPSLPYNLKGEFLPSNSLMQWLSSFSCRETFIPRIKICHCSKFVICGFNWSQTNKSMIQELVEHSGLGVSSSTVLHYGQEAASGEFCAFDFGHVTNLVKYGQIRPPQYRLDVVFAPVATYWSQNDLLAEPIDVKRLTSGLTNLVSDYEVPNANWTHQDFIYGIDAAKLVYPEVLKNMEKYRKN